ncbi:hypothetical protein CDCA_CDCA11G3239 [Cyanidium caldarium]|uniref:Elongation factor Ts, mitochondrial n=1 Tax=Cyanidium caldarium TaxID=2771 RepID=A0AAV9IYP0_CYACA|nr:hypothetical protein CDCA_CDCA11G3239 [Cyanidium caldarium]
MTAAAARVAVALVKQLRDATGAPVLECKRALEAVDSQLDAAVELLRARGAHVAARKANRSAQKALVALRLSDDGRVGGMLQLCSESDFVHGHDRVRQVAERGLQLLIEKHVRDNEQLLERLEPELHQAMGAVNEKVTVARSAVLEAPNAGTGRVYAYLHNNAQVGVLLALSGASPSGRNIAMHIAAMNPPFLSADRVDAAVLEREQRVAEARAIQATPDPRRQQQIARGMLRSFTEEHCLLEQTLVTEGAADAASGQRPRTVEEALGKEVQVVEFVRFGPLEE